MEFQPLATRPRACLLPILVLSVVGACTTPGGPPMGEIAQAINATLEPADYVVAPGDTLDVLFASTPEYNHQVLVQPDGGASFVALEHMTVAGLTTEQIEKRLSAAYVEEGLSGDLSVNLQVAAPRTITVLGHVNAPGVFPITVGTHTTLLDALALAGGPRRGQGYLGSLLLVRWDARNQRQKSWTIDARTEHWETDETILMQAYDLVYVPNTTIDKVNIWVDKYMRQLIPFPQVFVPTGQ